MRVKVLIRSVTANAFGPLVRRNVIEFGPGRTVVHGRNGTGKSVLFRAMRARLEVVKDVSAWPGWAAGATGPVGTWDDVGRVLVEVDDDDGDKGDDCHFLDDDGLELLLYDTSGWRSMDDGELDALNQHLSRHFARLLPGDRRRRDVVPNVMVRRDAFVMHDIDGGWIRVAEHPAFATGGRLVATLALALALRDVRSPRGPLVIDSGGLGVLERPCRDCVTRELARLDGQVILFTEVDDVAERLGIDYTLAPVRHARGIRVRRWGSRRNS